MEGRGSLHARCCVDHMLEHVEHAPTNKIYSHARVRHSPTRGCWMGKRLMAERSKGSPDHSRVARVVVKLHEVDRSDFENYKSKNFKKGADPRLRTACEG